MRPARWTFVLAVMLVMLFGVGAEARQVTVSYVDDNRPPEFSQADVVAGIQRAMREWEAHNSITSLIFHWGGVIPLSEAPDDFNNVVIRWAPTDYSSFRGLSCRVYDGCNNDPLDTPQNHIWLASFAANLSTNPPTQRWNNPKWTFDKTAAEDMISCLMHEMGHLFRNLDNSGHTPMSVLNAPAVVSSRNLWNADILGVDLVRYPGHYQALQWFEVDWNTGGVSVLRHTLPPFRVLSPAAMATGDGVGYTGHYVVAYGTRTPAGSSGSRNAMLVRLTDGISSDVDRVVQGTLNGVQVAGTFHRPCVAAAASGTDHYLVWTSPVEDANGWRQVLAAESHNGGAITWSQPEVIPGAFTRSGVSCSIDRSTERLVVAFSGAGEEGIFLTHRPSLTAGAGLWAPVTMASRVQTIIDGKVASSYGPPDLAFDFFDTTSGTLTWQDNADLQVHSTSVSFSGGAYYGGSATTHSLVQTARLRSWPVAAVEGNDVLAYSNYVAYTTPAAHSEERRSFQGQTPNFMSTENYSVGAIHAARHYTGAASNRNLFVRGLLSTAIVAQ